MPFGSRLSSLHMQKISECIRNYLSKRDILCLIYLDDICVISSNASKAQKDKESVLNFLSELGLEVAVPKLQGPDTKARWLGIDIDIDENTLKIPYEKIVKIRAEAFRLIHSDTISDKELESIIGRLLNTAKCIRAVRPFVSRLLTLKRDSKDSKRILLSEGAKRDLLWFYCLASTWNGTSILPNVLKSECIYVFIKDDYFYAYNSTSFYKVKIHCYSKDSDLFFMCNILTAVQTLGTSASGGEIKIISTNKKVNDLCEFANTRDSIKDEIARKIWLSYALKNCVCVFSAVNSVNSDLQYINKSRRQVFIQPKILLDVISFINRSGTGAARPKGKRETGAGQRTGDQKEP